MIRRFQIEDLIVQDSSGVVFRALDTETGKTVAVRRFFPFGADGGGLQADEQTAYTIAVNRLAGISHPALRAVICGGCDPVDGMPFIATEWIEGDSLDSFVSQNPIPVEAATLLITQALEVCELLSHVLAEEAVWVETDLHSIIVSRPDSGRGFTFWIAPLKWLAGSAENRGLQSIITLTEEVMGWTDKVVNDQAGRGLGGWLKWLRGAAATTTLHEARETLAASIGADPPAPAKRLASRAARPIARPIKRSKPKTLLIVNSLLALILLGLGGWYLMREGTKSGSLRLPEFLQKSVPGAPPEPETTASPDPATLEPAALPDMGEPSLSHAERVARANQLATELNANTAQADQEKQSILDTQKAAAEQNGGVIQWNHNELLISKHGTEVVVGGVFEKIDFSKSKKTMFVMFAQRQGTNTTRGTIELKGAPPDLTEAALKPLIGKRIRVHGIVKVQKGLGQMRPEITIKDRASIQVLD